MKIVAVTSLCLLALAAAFALGRATAEETAAKRPPGSSPREFVGRVGDTLRVPSVAVYCGVDVEARRPRLHCGRLIRNLVSTSASNEEEPWSVVWATRRRSLSSPRDDSMGLVFRSSQSLRVFAFVTSHGTRRNAVAAVLLIEAAQSGRSSEHAWDL